MQRLRPDDDFLLLVETAATPMQIGALLYLDTADTPAEDVFARLQAHLIQRLPATPLLRVLREAPLRYDAAIWQDVVAFDPSYHIRRCDVADESALRWLVASNSLERLDLCRPPFRIMILDQHAGSRTAVLITLHHALADGVGFQAILGLLYDGLPVHLLATRREHASPAVLWLARAALRFWRERPIRRAAAQRRQHAAAALAQFQLDPANRRHPTPKLKLSGPTSQRRTYATASLPFAPLRAAATRLGATINDLYLAMVGGAARRYLLAIGDLPDTALVANSARSYRRPEHGITGNRIVAIHPHLGTDIADPLLRLRAIQAAMTAEKRRTGFDEAFLDQPEIPFGPRDRRRKLARRVQAGGAVLPGNITVSNVPGPATPPGIAGFRLLANYPTPLLGNGRFLNVTSRRNGDCLDLGIMADPEKITDIDGLVTLLWESYADYAAFAAAEPQSVPA